MLLLLLRIFATPNSSLVLVQLALYRNLQAVKLSWLSLGALGFGGSGA